MTKYSMSDAACKRIRKKLATEFHSATGGIYKQLQEILEAEGYAQSTTSAFIDWMHQNDDPASKVLIGLLAINLEAQLKWLREDVQRVTTGFRQLQDWMNQSDQN